EYACPKCNNNEKNFLFPSIILILIYNSINKLVKRIRSEYRIGPHNKKILEIIYGSLLGDSHIEKHGNGSRISFSQESNREKYLLWLHQEVVGLGYCNPTTPKIQSRMGSKGKIRYTIRFHTFTYQSFNDIRNLWYQNNKKHIPMNIEEFLTPLAIAIWTIDDGARVGKTIKWCTNSFTYEECIFLAQILYKKYGLKCSVHSAGKQNQYVIYLLKESMSTLRNLIKPFMVSSMLYKIQE
uniref:LAGLIDADG homing endonuclease n=1 Tax=Malassezia caprae TaxID=1381934 RepID=UPI0030035E87